MVRDDHRSFVFGRIRIGRRLGRYTYCWPRRALVAARMSLMSIGGFAIDRLVGCAAEALFPQFPRSLPVAWAMMIRRQEH